MSSRSSVATNFAYPKASASAPATANRTTVADIEAEDPTRMPVGTRQRLPGKGASFGDATEYLDQSRRAPAFETASSMAWRSRAASNSSKTLLSGPLSGASWVG